MPYSFVDGVISDLLGSQQSEESPEQLGLSRVHQDFRRLASLEYCRRLRKGFEASAVHELVRRTKKEVWPHLNREQIKPRPTRFLAELSSGLGVDLQAYPQRGPVGLGLYGFYINVRHRPLKRPLIYVNTAHDRGTVASTFCHELGHHLGGDIFGKRAAMNLFFSTGYEDHLQDPVELAADVLVSLAGYPQAIACRIFGDPQKQCLTGNYKELSEEVLKKLLAYARRHYGLNLGRIGATEQKLQYLAGAIHYAKLRWALLAEYRI